MHFCQRLLPASYQILMGWLMQFSFPSHHEEPAELIRAAGECSEVADSHLLWGNSPDGVRPAPLQGLFCSLSSSSHGRPLPAPRGDTTGTTAGRHSQRWQQGSTQLWGPFLGEPEQETSPRDHTNSKTMLSTAPSLSKLPGCTETKCST